MATNIKRIREIAREPLVPSLARDRLDKIAELADILLIDEDEGAK